MKHVKGKLALLLSLSTFLLGACTTQPSGPAVTPSSSPSASPTASPVASPTASASPSQPVTALNQIGYGLSYGFCIGYCDHNLTITAERIRLVNKAFREPEKNPDQVIEKPTPPETWQKLNRLASFQTLQSLPDRIGCPDCADGGAESIELQQAEVSKRVTFEPQAGLPEQQELLTELRSLYETLNAEVTGSPEPTS